MVTRIFWILYFINVLGVATLCWLAARDKGPHDPNGGEGYAALFAILTAVYLTVMAIVGYFVKSDRVIMAACYFLGMPVFATIVGPIYSYFQNQQTERSVRGDDYFSGRARELAHAIYDNDTANVRRLAPLAGDLNRLYRGNNTLLRFASCQDAPESVKALIDAGADPNVPSGPGDWPLIHGFYRPKVARVLLDAGADPNRKDSDGQPVWWTALSSTTTDDGLASLVMVLDKGVDVRMRANNGMAPAAYAARMESWRGLWLILARGAEWKNEEAQGDPMVKLVAWALIFKHIQATEIPDDMRPAVETMAAQLTADR